MKQAQAPAYSRAGEARRSGRGIALYLTSGQYFIPPEEMAGLYSDRIVEVVDESGEKEGAAWLSPVSSGRKLDLTAVIRDRLFVVPVKDVQRLLAGGRNNAPVMEYLGITPGPG
ncbi:MAG: hypothetical protein LUQ01_00750 [Methanolinea sp.]|nr:hypothetical protein [Methanolinea sp.]